MRAPAMGRCWGSWTTPWTWPKMVGVGRGGAQEEETRDKVEQACAWDSLVRELTMLEFQWEWRQRDVFSHEREASQALAGKLEEVGGRAALLAGAIERDAGAGFGLKLDGGMADDLCEDERCSVEREVAVPDLRDDRGVGGAVLRDGREADSRCGGSAAASCRCSGVRRSFCSRPEDLLRSRR